MSTKPDTASPKMGSDISMLWPPANVIPALEQIARAPDKTSLATSGANLSTGHPSMAIATVGVPPIA
jgi:hypothetical protein